MYSRSHTTNSGYTLIELVVYIAIFTAISVFAVMAITLITTSFLDTRVERTKHNTALIAFERLVRETRLAEQVDITSSVFGTSPGVLVLHSTNDAGDSIAVSFFVDNGQLHITKDGTTSVLTPETIVIDTLEFYLITNNSVEAIKMKLTIHDTREDVPDRKTFHNTALLRGSY